MEIQKGLIWKTIVDDFFQKFINREDSVLDIACGYGEFVNNIRCKKKYGIDLNSDSIKKLNQDDTLRTSLVAAAEKTITENESATIAVDSLMVNKNSEYMKKIKANKMKCSNS